ncbi:antibiotic biosynthesis monooxygenase family protein [Actinoalloteichus spitiensis]|uniref:antibiotic biosynthesis monooxygenase family protein n=1 Tax=Actinoalloteichus spitiensis TaxID=252394 RepID=UPI0005856712|nr:antibiotic biosynthesis monooxygenase family protein [Actinoalloteichus spitiensis]
MSGSVFRVLLRIEVHPGMSEGFERAWAEVGAAATTHPANLGQWLGRDAENPDVYWVQSDWVDAAGFHEFEHSQRHVVHRRNLGPFRAGGSMTTMTVLTHLPPGQRVGSHAEWEAAG